MNEQEIARARAAILKWHDANARDLPWRSEKNPYRIWLSEIMLQQTRAEAVIPYYERFLSAYPDIAALADAEEESVLKLWEGLGYYSRARNLLRAACQIVAEYNGTFPRESRAIRALPGIGEYTAGAIASIAYGLPEPAIDGNQIRVLSRLFGIRINARSPEGKKRLRACAEALLSRQRPGDFNQALMGLGALVCLPRKPRCDACPAQPDCDAYKTGDPQALPILPEKAQKRTVPVAVTMVVSGERVFVRRRPDAGLLAGLWEFPCFENARTAAEVKEALSEIGIDAARLKKGARAEHIFTHLRWEMTGWHISDAVITRAAQGKFVDARELAALPMATAIRHFREAVKKELSKKPNEG